MPYPCGGRSRRPLPPGRVSDCGGPSVHLWIVSRGGEAVQDSVTIKYFSQHGKGSIQLCDCDVAVSEAGTETVISWAKSVAAVIAADPEGLGPDKSRREKRRGLGLTRERAN